MVLMVVLVLLVVFMLLVWLEFGLEDCVVFRLLVFGVDVELLVDLLDLFFLFVCVNVVVGSVVSVKIRVIVFSEVCVVDLVIGNFFLLVNCWNWFWFWNKFWCVCLNF